MSERAAPSVEQFSRKDSSLFVREEFALHKLVLVSHDRYKNRIILVPDVVNENELLLTKKYLSMEGVFLDRNCILTR